MSHKTDYAYIAGLIDGEGCIHIEKIHKDFTKRPSPQYQLKVFIGMTSLDCIKKIQSIFGGKFYSREREGTRFRSYNWYIFSNNAVNVLKKTLPYLQEKKEQVIQNIIIKKGKFYKKRKRRKI
jgi:hypothetical protein